MARTLDPDNDQARHGLENVGTRLIEQARAALKHNDFTSARSDLAAADEMLGGGTEIEHLKTELHAAETRNTAAADLLAHGDAALAVGSTAWRQQRQRVGIRKCSMPMRPMRWL